MISPVYQPYHIDLEVFLLLSISWGLCFFILINYPSQKEISFVNQLKLHIISSIIAFISNPAILFLLGKDFSRFTLILFGVIATSILYIPRLLYRFVNNKMVTSKFLIHKVLIPLFTLGIYSFSFSYISRLWLPDGVNIFFTQQLSKLLIYLIAIMLLSYGYLIRLIKTSKMKGNKTSEKLTFRDIFILLIPLSTVFQYLVNNNDIISLLDALIIFIAILFFCLLFAVILPILLRSFSSFRVQSAIGFSFVFIILNMGSLSQLFSWINQGNIIIQISILVGSFILFYLLNGIKGKSEFLFVIITFFIFSVINPLISNKSKDETPDVFDLNHPIYSLLESRLPNKKPDIYLLVYDAYVSNETMQGYGIDNNSQETYLREKGFEIYPNVYSVDAETLGTMSRVLNASNSYYGNKRRGVSGDGVVHQAFRYLDYETYGVFNSDYMFRGYGSSYDVSLPKEISIQPYIYLLSAIAIGEFRYDLEFDLEFSNISYSDFVTNKENIFSQDQDAPIFLYAHSPYPGHSQNSGACLPNEVELFKERLSRANQEMKQDIELLIMEKNSIIIVAGDHGPYLTKNCTSISHKYETSDMSRLDIQDRFGTFLAIRWPDENYHDYDDITVTQDLFVSIFAYLYEEPSLLEWKIPTEILSTHHIRGACVVDGVIVGGSNDGEPLFIEE